jgi:hypothetical protein
MKTYDLSFVEFECDLMDHVGVLLVSISDKQTYFLKSDIYFDY